MPTAEVVTAYRRLKRPMLETIVVILVIMWLLGYFVVNLGAVVHFLLVLALVVFIVRLIRGRPTTV